MPSRIPIHRPQGLPIRQRGSTERGYDAAWQRLRAAFVGEWLRTRGPVCGICKRPLTGGRQTHVDHIVEFNGVDDPLRLDCDNLQVLCDGCNARKARGK